MTDRFHGCYDSGILGFSGKPVTVEGPITERVRVTTRNRKLSYQFYAHFHPYVAELVGHLIKQSVSGLQAIDTKYCLAGALSAKVQAKLSDGTPLTLSAGTSIRIPDGTPMTLASGTSLKLSGRTLVGLSDGKTMTLPKKTAVTLAKGTSVQHQGGGVKLQETATVSLSDGKPRPLLYEEIFSKQHYDPNPELVPNTTDSPHPVKDLDFTSSGAYSIYNWELFYHVPLAVALHLSKNQRFADAQQWLHYIFDPTDDSDGPTPERFWKVKPFQTTDVKRIEEIMLNLSTGADTKLQKETISSIEKWKNNPFRPHVVARYRQSAYMYKAMMAYLDNLIDWGDSLFRQDTRETVNEALQLYVLAANILGPRPQLVPKKGSVRPQTYANLRKGLDKLSNALRDFEADIAFDSAPHPGAAAEHDGLGSLSSVGKALYFCVPHNDRLVDYWDKVADRLYKIRNSLNIQGIFRQLPLFEPPIDPGLLAKAAAAGLDVGAIVSGLNQPLPLVRFQLLVQKAAEICQEVKSLGGNLLAAVEKEDNETLAILRAKHERVILALTDRVRYAQWQEAIKAREGLEKSFENVAQRYIYYQRLLGENEKDMEDKIDTSRSNLGDLDTSGFEKSRMAFKASEPSVEPEDIGVDIAQDAEGVSSGNKLNRYEIAELNSLEDAQVAKRTAAELDKTAGGIAAFVPDFEYAYKPMGSGWAFRIGRSNLIALFNFLSSFYKADADELMYEANKSAKIGSFAIRQREHEFQRNAAAGELTQILKQLRAAQIREYIAQREWQDHKQRIRQAEEIEYFLTGEKDSDWKYKIDPKQSKTADKALYTWMKREVKALYGQSFQLAFDIAKKAERALQHELGDPKLSYLQFGYLAGKEGLLAGEKLFLDIKRMEMAYHDLNRREYEITKHVSLLQVDPLELLKLRATGSCTLSVPEELFDLDCPGHYFRRIKTVAVSIPCVTGPYTSINCTLTLLKSAIRKTSQVGAGGYAREDKDGIDDARFSDYFGSLQSIVTSTGQNDSGLFETNLRDERYLPFEGSGVVSQWQLALPANLGKKEPDPCPFDYETISDVVLHIRYTAREGGALLRKAAISNLTSRIDKAKAAGSVRLFSVRHEFPDAWAKLKNATIPEDQFAELTFELKPVHYPFWSEGRRKVTTAVELFAKGNQFDIAYDAQGAGKESVDVPRFGETFVSRKLKSPVKALKTPIGNFLLFLDDNSMKDLFIAVTWGKE